MSFDFSQRLSALRRSRFSLQNVSEILLNRFGVQNCSEILLNQGVGLRLRTAMTEKGVLVKNGTKLFIEIGD